MTSTKKTPKRTPHEDLPDSELLQMLERANNEVAQIMGAEGDIPMLHPGTAGPIHLQQSLRKAAISRGLIPDPLAKLPEKLRK